jgi:RNA-binding protein YlmH
MQLERLHDLADQAADQGYLTHTRFLTPAEQTEAAIWLRKNRVRHVFHGGYEGAERQVCFLLPDYLDEANFDAAEVITALHLATPRSGRPTAGAALTHRDYLGSLLGLGINRDQLGDILVGEGEATVLVLASMVLFIENHLQQIGSLPVTMQPIALTAITVPARAFTTMRITVASLRLDKIAASGFGISRTEMADFIRSGQVQLNWVEEQRPDQPVPIGATISLRGHGRIRLASEEGLSRKDRHILVLEKY